MRLVPPLICCALLFDAGLSLTTPTASSSTATDQVRSYSFNSRSNVGIVLHF